MEIRHCAGCGAAFVPRWSKKSRPQKCCSKACGDEVQRKRVKGTCTQCGADIQLTAAQTASERSRGAFCNSTCYGDWQRAHTRGVPKQHLATGTIAGRGRADWRRARKSVLKRDGYRCTKCGCSPARLDVHHIRPFDPNDSHTHDPANLITLCPSCHKLIHLKAELTVVPANVIPFRRAGE